MLFNISIKKEIYHLQHLANSFIRYNYLQTFFQVSVVEVYLNVTIFICSQI